MSAQWNDSYKLDIYTRMNQCNHNKNLKTFCVKLEIYRNIDCSRVWIMFRVYFRSKQAIERDHCPKFNTCIFQIEAHKSSYAFELIRRHTLGGVSFCENICNLSKEAKAWKSESDQKERIFITYETYSGTFGGWKSLEEVYLLYEKCTAGGKGWEIWL